MKKILTKSALAAVMAIAFAACGETEPTEWRLFSYIHDLKRGDDASCTALFNVGRHDLKRVAPLKIEAPAAKGAVYEVTVNGQRLEVAVGESWSVEIPFGKFRNNDNKLEIRVAKGSDEHLCDVDRIGVYGTVSALKGPRVTERDFFLLHLDKTIPEFRAAADKAAAGDMDGAKRLFADYVRKHYRVQDHVLKDYLHPDKPEVVLKRGDAVKHGYVWSIGTYRFKDKHINWAFNPTWNGYCEWCYHLAYFTSMDYLTRRYALKGEEEYAELARQQYREFFEKEPPPADYIGGGGTFSWRSLETGGRIGGIFANDIYFLLRSPGTTDDFITTYFRSFWDHCTLVRKSHAGSGNWRTNEMTGLLVSTYMAPYFTQTKEWREYSLGICVQEFSRQIYPDGQQDELSTGYHVGVAMQFMRIPAIYKMAGVEPPAGCLKTVETMFNPYMILMRPDRRVPSLNDAGNATVREFLSYGITNFPHRKRDFEWFATDGKEGEPPKWTSRLMPYAGWAVMRSGWGPKDLWAHMDCGPFGTGHQHEDKGSIQMWAHGTEMISEAGWYDYDTSDMRKYVLSTRGHNTVRIDGQDQNRRRQQATYAIPHDVVPNIPFSTSDTLDLAEMTYSDGYAGRVGRAVTHRRRLMFFKRPEGTRPFFAVVDRLAAGDGKSHSYEQIWHLQAGEFESLQPLSFVARYPNGARLAAAFSDSAAKIVDKRGQKEPELQGWNPGRWDKHNASPIATPVLCGPLQGSRRIVTVFQPWPGECAGAIRVKASADVAEKSFTLVLADGRELTFTENAPDKETP